MVTVQKRFVSLFVCFALLLSLVPSFTATAAAKAVNVTVDGKKLTANVSPQTVNGRTFVPYRAIAEAIGATVKFDSKTNRATITKGKQTVELTVGSKTAKINGSSAKLDAAPLNVKGTLLVPLRFVGESLGVWVTWKASTSTAALETKKTIKHSLGSTTLNSVPKRAVVLFNGAVDISVLLEVKPVGAVESYIQQPFYEYIRPKLKGTKTLGDETQPNLEAIAALKPDVIIATKVRHEKIHAQLKSIAPTIVTEDLSDWQDNLQIQAQIFNKEEIAAEFLAEWKAKVADFKRKLPAKDKGAAISIIRFNPDGSARAYNAGFAYKIFKELGFSTPKQQLATGQEFITVSSLEQVSLLDGDYIFDFTTDWDGDGAVLQHQKKWTTSDLWKNLNAVKKDKYYKVNSVTWNLSGGAMAADLLLDDLYFHFDLE
ncbi:ABC-type Fe3+-hydroxamate transport system substrate-binding protein [Paenibacillus phyllosphaerae]|uniref:ABC-type Fe3+-hydroxamate transport system substrate-binding protein n=1 Tax=Paenibacillus phyllosphaerae TaxID=274593 RepID=A0A7W5AZL6_9BACL|nr:stalk domain-containing protein [Paenibacillus phyllosphaerae]MBB3111705.1 ABC-type Fe3+-hydroxamate transport system substrate-binding protein [Paenibacillus phyllosphaerae]